MCDSRHGNSSVFTGSHLVAAFLLCDSISCFRHNIPSMVSGPDSAPARLGRVADGSRRDEASPLSLPGPFTDSDSEPYGSTAATRMEGETVGKSEKEEEIKGQKMWQVGWSEQPSSQSQLNMSREAAGWRGT